MNKFVKTKIEKKIKTKRIYVRDQDIIGKDIWRLTNASLFLLLGQPIAHKKNKNKNMKIRKNANKIVHNGMHL